MQLNDKLILLINNKYLPRRDGKRDSCELGNNRQNRDFMKIFIWVGTLVGGTGGWYLGALFGEFWIPTLISGIGSIAGVIIGWKIGRMLE